jgi:DNA segregation ATPase FtsK/SpoIIIE-like protein
MAIEYIDRPPRIQPELPVAKIPIPPPPEQGQGPTDWVTQILPLVTIFGFIFVAGSGGGAGGLFIIPMAGAMILSVGYSLYANWKAKQGTKLREKQYADMLVELRQDMTRQHNAQRLHYRHNYPDVGTLLDIAARKETSRFGSRLWERRPGDRDFGAFRIGVGSRPSTVIYEFSNAGGTNQSPLARDASQLAADSHVLSEAPVTVPLRPAFAPTPSPDGNAPAEGNEGMVPSKHSLGIFGSNPNQTADYTRALLAHFCGFHSAQDTRLFVIGHPHNQTSWQWAEWLPHATTRGIGDEDDGKPKQYDQLCFTDENEAAQAFWKRIKRELDQRQVRLRDTSDDEKASIGDVSLPFLLIVVDLLGDMPEDSPLKEVSAEAVVATVNSAGPTLGAAVIFLGNSPQQIPSECLAMIEVAAVGEKTVFRYTEVGFNAPRYLGTADLLNAQDARQQFAAKIRRLELQRPFGSDLPRSVDLLQMESVIKGKRINTADKISIEPNWKRSLEPKNQEWLSAPIGMVSSREVRNLVFSAKEGGDGVHGMIAGTTGSGKSELLLTLIAGLAIKYDPRIVNFVLVDFKGGAAFEPFKKLPHVVDILTNLQANAVERMFVAIQAVMEDRAALLARSNAKDLVDYRAKVVPRLGPDDDLPRTFPHLFIIVDEFAEMITQNPDYKAQFESVTRLGRAFGVSLLLATQRPAGVVSDQMRANMKFRICLRVETAEDSKELLARPDAAFLPNIGGRGYIQVGNDVLTAMQVARAGGDYTDDRTITLPDVVWLDETPSLVAQQGPDAPLYSPQELAEALSMKPGEVPTTLVDWVVGIAAIRAKRDGVPPQSKPWPEPLPEFLSLTEPVDARYLNTEREIAKDDTLVINPDLKAWLNNEDEKPLWEPVDWRNPRPLRAAIGLVDNPYQAEQRILEIDATSPIAVFGLTARGKSTFVKSLFAALAAQRSPAELNMYALDFGRGGLKSIRDIPHLGAAIDASEAARVDQLIRMVRNFVNERQERLSKYANLFDHNVKNPGNILPEIVVVIDNFAEFKESYEHQIPELLSLIRDGRAFGVYFMVTAATVSDLGSKLMNTFGTKLTFTQSDRFAYADIVGQGARSFDNVPGRGLISLIVKDNPKPLEFHVGMPGNQAVNDDLDAYQVIAGRMDRAWASIGGKRPAAELPRSINILEMYTFLEGREIKRVGDLPIGDNWRKSMLPEHQEWLKAPIGLISSKEIRTMYFQAQADGVHGMVAGTTGSGKSELLLTMIGAMAIRYDPRIVNFVLVDFKGGAAFEPFKKLPHCVDIATNLQGNAVERIFIAIKAEMDRRSALLARSRVDDLVKYRNRVIPQNRPDLPPTFPHLFVVVDEFAEMISANPDYKLQFEQITRLGRAYGVSLVLATQRPAGVVSDQMRANMKFRICLRVETPEDSKELLRKPDAARLPQIGGRGYIQAGSELLTEVQVARAGGDYTDDVPDPVYPTEEILTSLGVTQETKPGLMIDWIVGALAAEAKRQGIPKQFKPWPDPLPEQLNLIRPVDATYIYDDVAAGADKIVLCPELAVWADSDQPVALWKPWDWQGPLPMKATFGIVDNPFRAEQKLLSLDLSQDPIVVFGASGRGKSTFVKSLLFTLAAQRSPNELHMYALDFGRGGLKALRALPHCGATIDASQPERVAQLFRMVRGLMTERQEKLAKFSSIEEYNQLNKDNPDLMFPSVIVVIDNFAEFKENYEAMLDELIGLVRDGRAFGIYYIITAGQQQDIPNKLLNLMTQRVAFTMADPMAYADLIGRGSISLTNVPGRGLINIEGLPLEFHVATPILPHERDAYSRIAEKMETAWLGIGGKKPAAEIPRSVNLLEMYQTILGKRVERIGDLPIAENWKQSMVPEHQDWLSAPIGLVSSKEIRTMKFSAKADGDGVHGMIAGTTGSGKSELLLTLIGALAAKYDPRIVNFVLVDYKGGAAFEPFKKLPHCVDIATNLQGNAVERIFIAIKAEMDRRSKLLADGRVGDLVDYRKRVIPRIKPGDGLAPIFPHLFVIVDEFAEMIVQNPDYKLQFEQITRLGRAFGVTLILATQRPAGAVSDQMRANMKFRICLRVETADDSKELLKRPDAAMLPAIGGRGYVQVGGGALTEVQVARAGGDYTDDRPDPVYPSDEVLEALEVKPENKPGMMIDWLVGALAAEAKRQDVPKQYKPWPDPLPEQLPLNQPFDASYIDHGQRGPTLIINPEVQAWCENTEARPIWTPFDFSKGEPQPVDAPLGIMDNPYLAEQRVFTVNLAGDPIALLGASGRGKSTFVLSLATALTARYSPADLHLYAIDFGRGGLKALRALPHVAGVVEGNEEERVERLLRMLRTTIDERQARLQAYDSLHDYNAKNPDNPMPAIAVFIDNCADLKETYDRFLGEILAQVREGRSFGVYFVITGSLMSDFPSKLFNLLGNKITFLQSDPGEYTMILGRGWTRIPDVPGRGLVLETIDNRPQPLEFHTAIPVLEDVPGSAFRELFRRMATAWEQAERDNPTLRARRPRPVEPLATLIDLPTVLGMSTPVPANAIASQIGINDLDREATILDLTNKGPNLVIMGPPVSGKTTLLRSFILGLAQKHPPERLAFVLIDPSDGARRFFAYGTGDQSLDRLPHVLATVNNSKEMDAVAKRLRAEYDEEVIARLRGKGDVYREQDNTKRTIVVIIDHYDDVQGLDKGKSFSLLAEIGKGKNMHLVIAGSLNINRGGMDEVKRRVDGSRYNLVLQDFETIRYMGVRINFQAGKELPAGRGFLVKSVSANLVQTAVPVIDGKNGFTAEEQLQGLFNAIRRRHGNTKAVWSYFASDLTALDAAIKGEEPGVASSAGAPAELSPTSGAFTPTTISMDEEEPIDLAALLAEQATATQAPAAELPLKLNFASVVVERDDETGEILDSRLAEEGEELPEPKVLQNPATPNGGDPGHINGTKEEPEASRSKSKS